MSPFNRLLTDYQKLFYRLGLVLMYQCQQTVDSLFLRNILQHTFLATIEGYLSATGTYVSVVGISHFTWAVDDTSHDTYLQTCHVLCSLLDTGDGGTQIIECTTATRTGDILGLGSAKASCLQDTKRGGNDIGCREVSLIHKPDTVTESIYQQGTHIGGSLKQKAVLLRLTVMIAISNDSRVGDAGSHQSVDDGTVLAYGITHGYHDNLRVLLQILQKLIIGEWQWQLEEMIVTGIDIVTADNHGRLSASDSSHGMRLALFGMQIIESLSWLLTDFQIGSLTRDIIHEMTGYGNFSFWLFGQAHTDGITDTVEIGRAHV